jgi:branched-chain amino acid transport system ATP-binding protein
MTPLVEYFFSPRGRFNTRQYWLAFVGYLVVYAIYCAIGLIIVALFGDVRPTLLEFLFPINVFAEEARTYLYLGIIPLIPVAVSSVAVAVKRLHDMGLGPIPLRRAALALRLDRVPRLGVTEWVLPRQSWVAVWIVPWILVLVGFAAGGTTAIIILQFGLAFVALAIIELGVADSVSSLALPSERGAAAGRPLGPAPATGALLETNDLEVFYHDFQALFGVSIRINEGETVAVIGANGAGKSSFMKAIAGINKARHDAILLEGQPTGTLPAYEMVKLGIALVPEGRRMFPSLSVEENLLIGATGKTVDRGWTLDTVYDLFPILRERRRLGSTTLSGGQQQMVAIGRALMSNPRILLCDEISLGLAPSIIRDVYAALDRIRQGGTTILLVEQDLKAALGAADRVYCFMEGRVTLEGRPGELSHGAIHNAYFGV